MASKLSKCCFSEESQPKVIQETSVTFTINGKTFNLKSGDVSPSLSLGRFIRDYAYLKGTKISCNQGGCGACVVTVKAPQVNTGLLKTMSINSVSKQD